MTQYVEVDGYDPTYMMKSDPPHRLARLAFIMSLALAACSNYCLAQTDGLSIKVLHRTGETDACLSRMQRGLSTIPLKVQKEISDAGISVVLTPLMTYDEPESSGQTVFREGGTTENIGGLYEPSKNRVIIPERASWHNSAPRSMGDYMIKVMRHELGHAWDFALGRVSQTQAFILAYDQDFSKLSNEQCRTLAYVITGTGTGDANVPTASGHHECFAEAFEALTTPHSSWKKGENQQMTAFPHVAEYLQSLNDGLRKAPEESEDKTNVVVASHPTASINPDQKAAENESATSNVQFEQAVTLFKQKQYAQALSCLDLSVKANPKNAKAFLLRGTTQMWLHNYKASVQDYTSYLALHPKDADAYSLRGRAYQYMGLKTKQDQDEAMSKTLR